MADNRELLELAARAAGYTLKCGGTEKLGGDVIDFTDLFYIGDGWTPWNPLADDGDALRLAVKLELSPSVFLTAGLTIVSATNRPFTELEIEQEHEDGPYAATRLAIVRAAAEVGRGIAPQGGQS